MGFRKNDQSPDEENEDGESVSADDEDGGADNYRDGNDIDDDQRKTSSVASGGSKVTVNPAPLAM